MRVMAQKKAVPTEFYDFLSTPVGTIYLIFSSGFLTGISFEKPSGMIMKKSERISSAKKELLEYFDKKRKEFSCKTLFVHGTDFEKKVWNALRSVPYGETRTYKWIAAEAGKPDAFRAAGNALGRNPIPVIFPCHRIIESDGSLGGYSSGADIKRRLLESEYYAKLEEKD